MLKEGGGGRGNRKEGRGRREEGGGEREEGGGGEKEKRTGRRGGSIIESYLAPSLSA